MNIPDPGQFPPDSPLSQSVTRDGKTVKIQIYEDGEGGWLLEVVDEYDNSFLWRASFKSDQEALDGALKVIDELGIDALIGPPPEDIAQHTHDGSRSTVDLEELDDFLAQAADEQASMDVSTLDGFLTAIAIGPRLVLPSEWLPWVWDMEDGETGPTFKDQEQASRIMSLIMNHYNSVVEAFNSDPASFEPVFWSNVYWGAAEWCEGFFLGFQFNEHAWGLLAVAHPTWMTPFLSLGADDDLMISEIDDDADKWVNEIRLSLIKIHKYWKSHHSEQSLGKFNNLFNAPSRNKVGTQVRDGPKIGRNDPCPCGSGKKFKKCCGVDGGLLPLH